MKYCLILTILIITACERFPPPVHCRVFSKEDNHPLSGVLIESIDLDTSPENGYFSIPVNNKLKAYFKASKAGYKPFEMQLRHDDEGVNYMVELGIHRKNRNGKQEFIPYSTDFSIRNDSIFIFLEKQ